MSDGTAIQVSVLDSLASIDATAWDALNGTGNPFVSYGFLRALELGDCLAPYGWHPHYFCLQSEDARLLAAAPCYVKTNSFGEFVFDWSWADAYERHGLAYYPKLVNAIPFTPSYGPRFLLHPEAEPQSARQTLIAAMRSLCAQMKLSGAHCLFPQSEDFNAFEDTPFQARLGVQFHWQNQGYANFEDFLDQLNARKRKKIRRERRQVTEAGIECQWRTSANISDAEIDTLHALYASTYDRKWGAPALSPRFFREVAQRLKEQFLVLFAYRESRPIAVAILYRDQHTLYGRHWGCSEHHHSLHFEACYYRGIEYCIEHGLQRFDPGAQGEHKIARGFLPVETWSRHWLQHSGFAEAVGDFLHTEKKDMQQHIEALRQQSPYARPDGK